jgi:hypothetical protein
MTNFLTALPPLEPYGLGTPHVESLSHYLLRMADICELPVSSLSKMIYRPLAEKYAGTSLNLRFALNGSAAASIEKIEVLESLTGNPRLRFASFWAFTSAVRMTSFQRIADFRRCPRCISDPDPSANYEQLIWSVPLYTSCLLHDVELEVNCIHCGCHQLPSMSLARRRFCNNCHKPLGHPGIHKHRSPVDNWANHVLGDLVEWCSTEDRAYRVPLDWFSTFLESVDESYSHYNKRHLKALLYYVTVNRASHVDKRRPRLTALMNLSALQGVHPLDALLRPRESGSLPLFDYAKKFKRLPFSLTASDRDIRHLHECVVALLASDLPWLFPLPNLSQLFAVSALRYSAMRPEESSAYKLRSSASPSIRSSRQTKLIFSAAMRGIETLTEEYTTAVRDLLATSIADTESVGFAKAVLDTAAHVSVFTRSHRSLERDEAVDADTALMLPTSPSIFVSGHENGRA